MDLKDRIDADIKAAMLAREKDKLRMLPETFEPEEIGRYVEGYNETPAEEPTAESDGVEDLRRRALEYLQKQQQADGSWANQEPESLEDDPLLATALGLRTMSLCEAL